MDSNLDPEAQAAISELASQLQPALRDVIDAAIREALDKLEDSLQSRREEFTAASLRLEEALNGLGREMKAKAGIALSEGIQQKVIPALEEESRRAAAETANAVGSRLESAERAMANLEVTVRESGGRVSEALELNRRVSAGALSTAQGEIADAIKKTGESSLKATSAALGYLDERIGVVTADSSESMKRLVTAGFDRSADVATSGFSSVQRELSNISEQSAKALVISTSVFGQLDGRLGEVAEALTKQLRTLSTQEDQRARDLLEDASNRSRMLTDQVVKETKQIALAQGEAEKEIITASQQSSAAVIQELSKINRDVNSRMDDIAQQVTLAAEQQRSLAFRNVVLAVILILLSATIIGLLLHLHWF